MAFDPGEHIGWARFVRGTLHQSGMHYGSHWDNLEWLLAIISRVPRPDRIVCESYRIYKTHALQHIDSDVPTLRIIGAIEMLTMIYGVPLTMQSAAQGKAFVTDDKLERWGFHPETPHEADAIRHGLHYLIKPNTATGGTKLERR